MISQFPDFTSISMDLKNALTEYSRQFDPYEDFSFINLYTWDIGQKLKVAWLNGNLVIQIPNYLDSNKYSYTFIGNHELDDTVKTLLNSFDTLELIPAFIITGLKNPEEYAIAEDRDSFDYMYFVDRLADLKGRKLRKKRNIAKSTRAHLGSSLRCETVDKLSSDQISDIKKVIDEWFKNTDQHKADTESEYIALERVLKSFNNLDLWITLCYLDESLVGFSVHEIINTKYAICHFEKSLNNLDSGLNTILIQEAAIFLKDRVEIVNWQQDLGIESLRKAKRAYAPSYFLRKYWINNGL